MAINQGFTDTAGNTLRETSSGWEILQRGVGWREFIGYTILTDGQVVDTRIPGCTVEYDINAKESSHQKQLEDDLFRHYAGIAFQSVMPHAGGEMMNSAMAEQGFGYGNTDGFMAKVSCDYAQAMIDELKKRGRL